MSDDETPWLSHQEQDDWRSYLRASRKVWVALDRDLRKHFDLSLAEYEILSMVSEAEGMRMRMSALAEIVVQSRSRLTHTAKRLESRDLVRRLPVPDDRRGVELVLTDAGVELLEEAAKVHVRGVRKYIVDVLEPQAFSSLGASSARMASALGDAADDPGPGEGF